MRQEAHQPVVADVIKEPFDVGLDQPLRIFVRDDLVDSSSNCTTDGLTENLMGSPVAEALPRTMIQFFYD